jgi:hypothetical protein
MQAAYQLGLCDVTAWHMSLAKRAVRRSLETGTADYHVTQLERVCVPHTDTYLFVDPDTYWEEHS